MKCAFGFTPVPGCDNCDGTGIFEYDENGQPLQSCIHCLDEAIRTGEVDGSFGSRSDTLEYLLPSAYTPLSYYLLSNGTRYAKYGEEEVMEGSYEPVDGLGLLVFLTLDAVYNFLLTKPKRAKDFLRMNGAEFSEFTPCIVAQQDLLPIVKEHGGLLIVPYRLGFMAGWLEE